MLWWEAIVIAGVLVAWLLILGHPVKALWRKRRSSEVPKGRINPSEVDRPSLGAKSKEPLE